MVLSTSPFYSHLFILHILLLPMSQSFTTSAIPTPFQPHRDHHIHPRIPQQPHPPGDNDKSSEKDDTSSSSSGERLSPIISCILAGGFGGAIGDSSMHSLDTVKTRQQGLLFNPKYKRMIPAYATIIKEEGFFRGLYGGYTPAILGSFPSTATFFGTYELSKRAMIGWGVNDTIAYFVAGVLGDLSLSIFYVPSEVLKTRLQLQGRYNNPYTRGSGYNYRGLIDAVRSISKTEGTSALTYGYKETLLRDLPFSALQFAFYEKFRQLAIQYNNADEDLPIYLELFTGAAAGGLAGTLTTPLDVIKTRIQTATTSLAGSHEAYVKPTLGLASKILDRFSTLNALHSIYRNEGVLGLLSGVGPRFIWTGVQSSIMLLLYQTTLRRLDAVFDPDREEKLVP